MAQRKTSIFLDSGAFSAWNAGAEIDIDEYAEYCLANLDCVDYIANLDVIPGTPGKPTTAEERASSARKGWSNYIYLLDKGIPHRKLMHIFHQDEDFKWLRRMVKYCPFVGLSPANDRTTKQKIGWLDLCMRYVIDRHGYPILPFHGFAVTSVAIMVRYPWWSVDSTSWVIYGKFGMILVPKVYRDRVDFLKTERVFVSNQSPKQSMDGKHFNSYSPMMQNKIMAYVESKGYTVPQLANDHRKRDEINLIYYLELEKSLPEWPWKYEPKPSTSLGIL
jgi:hypothetical protein